MLDFNNKEIKIGSRVFFLHEPSNPIIGKVSKFETKSKFLVSYFDVEKWSDKEKKRFDENKEIDGISNIDENDGYIVKCDTCVIID